MEKLREVREVWHTTSANAQSAYEVTANLGDHLLATCIYHNSLKHREGQKDLWITEAYLVEKASIGQHKSAYANPFKHYVSITHK